MMKFSCFIVLFFSCVNLSLAQYDSEGPNKSRFRPGLFWYLTGYRPAKIEKVRKYDRLVVDVTYNDWTGGKKSFQNHWASFGLNTNFMFDIPVAKKNVFSIGIGTGYGYTTIRHNQVISSIQGTQFTKILTADSLPFKRNSLIGHQLSLPIELRFRSKGWRHIKFHLGGKIGYQFGLYSKTHALTGESPKKFKTQFNDPNRLVYSVHARIGIRNWAVYGSYNFNRVFKNSKSTPLNLFQVGLSLSLF